MISVAKTPKENKRKQNKSKEIKKEQ